MNFYASMGTTVPAWAYSIMPFMPLLLLWSLLWKGLGLWHAGRREQGWWFVAILLINTAGILELVYLFGILKLKFNELFGK